MSRTAAFWKWSLLGFVVAGLMVGAQAIAVDGVTGLLQVGETSSLRPMIEEQLGPVPLAPGPGHDGQIYYAMALDLAGDDVPDLFDHGGYRYRRIFYPLTASLGGLLDGEALLYSMVIVSVLSAALAAGAAAALSVGRGGSEWLALAVVLNPGMWLSIRLLTADTLAMALMLVALLALTDRHKGAITAFALSGLTKDVFLATPGGLALSRDRRRWPLVLVPLAVLSVWMVWLTLTMGEGFTGRGNVALPFVGIVEAASVWPQLGIEEWVYLVFALASVAVGLVVGILRPGWLRWSILAWSMLGVISSNWVWDFGNNAARAFAPIAVLVALAYVPTATARPSVTSFDGLPD